MKFGSLCSGIEAASVAWESLGWSAEWLAEIESFPSAVLAHHWPTVPNLGDMTTIADLLMLGAIDAPDILVGGTPCQSFSVAGLRKGLSDERGNLTLEYVRIANEIDNKRPANDECVCVWENVPGVFSSKDNAFGAFLAGLAGESVPLQPPGKRWANAGYVSGPQRAIAWRVIDAQYIGLAQRRKRVFVVASTRDGFDPAAVLFESDSMRRDTPPSREAGQNSAADVARSVRTPSHWDGNGPHPTLNQSHNTGGIGASNQEVFSQRGAGLVAHCTSGNLTHTLTAEGFDASEDGTGRGTPVVAQGFRMAAFGEYADDETASTMKARDYKDATARSVAYPITDKATRHAGVTGKGSGNGMGIGQSHDPSPTLTAGDKHAVFSVAFRGRDGGVAAELGDNVGNTLRANCGGGGKAHVLTNHEAAAVRRLTPTECARLQGFPDDHCRIPMKTYDMPRITRLRPADMWDDNTLMAADGPQYKAYGNSMAVSVMRWLGMRIQLHLLGLL